MCAIVGSFSKDKLKELIELNSYRGNHSYSLTEYDPIKKEIGQVYRDFGEVNYSLLDSLDEGMYYIAHTQAPTTQAKGHNNIHPSVLNYHWLGILGGQSLLWHNGIIKENCIKEMQSKLNTTEKWDTKLLHEWRRRGYSLNEIDGTFSCLFYYEKSNEDLTFSGDLYLFRNEISPMFMDNNMNLSSTKFIGSYSTLPNKVLKLDFENQGYEVIEEFETKENPYYFE